MTQAKLEIRGGRVIDPASGHDAVANVYIENGRILALAGTPPSSFKADEIIDAVGCVVCPGLIDLSVRLPSMEQELAAAVAGGVTSVICPPDTRPPLDEPGLVERLIRRSSECNAARVYPLGALTHALAGDTLAEMASLAAAGCIAFSQAKHPVNDTLVLLRALQYAASLGLSVWLQPQDYHLARGGVAHDGEIASRLGLPGIPTCAETIAILTTLELVRVSGARVHFRRLSSAAGVQLLAAAHAEDLPISADVSAYHLHLTERDIGFFDSNARLSPPLRTAEDRAALRKGLDQGWIQAICSDHTPIDGDGKLLPFGEADEGASGVELLLPLTLALANGGDRAAAMPLIDCLACVTSQAAGVAGLTDAGRLTVGQPADLCVFRPDEEWRVGADTLVSGGINTPVLGSRLQGRNQYTVVAGRLVFARR